MSLKVLFLATSALIWLNRLQVPNLHRSFSSVTCHRFRKIERPILHDFVTYSEMVDKWMSSVSYVASDQRPIEMGKTYKVIIDSSIILLFNITNHIPGRHITLESQSNFLQPHLELWFFDENRQQSAIGNKPPERPSASNDPMNDINTRSNSSSSTFSLEIATAAAASTKLPPQTGVLNGNNGGCHHHHHHHHACWIGQSTEFRREMKVMDARCGEAVPANVISGDAEHHRHSCRRRRRRHRRQDPQPENVRGSRLGLKFYFKHNSFLFQHTLGRLLRHMIGRHFRRSLRHLELILDDMEKLQRNLYR